jgi:protein-tyrosine phosphatase
MPFSFFSSKKKENKAADTLKTDFSFLGTDMHSHFIPGIDDGAQTIEDSLNLVRFMQEIGYRSIVTTPHIKFDHFPNTSQIINNGLEAVRQALHENGIHMPVRAAAEYYIDDHFMHLLDTEPLLTVGNNEVLVELSFMFEPLRLNEIFFKMQAAGYRPILAHPERYAYYHGDKEVFRDIADRGVKLQLNALAISGYYGRTIKDCAEWLLENRLYTYCGTDMHHMQHAANLQKLAESRAFAQLQQYPFQNAQLL